MTRFSQDRWRGGAWLATAAALLLAGCGGSSYQPSATPAATTAESPPGSVPVLTPSTTSDSPSTPAKHLTQRHFQELGGAVCRAVGFGSPPSLPLPVTASKLRNYALQALPPAERTFFSLERLARQTARQPGLRQLVTQYRSLVELYLQAALHPAAKARVVASARAISSAQQVTAVAARRAGISACAPSLGTRPR